MLFSDVFVPQQIKQVLINTVQQERVSHAQLFLGQPGTHSLGLALAYAQYLNCSNRTETDSCDVCPSCVKYKHLSHPDLHFFFPNTTTTKIKKDTESATFYAEWRDIIKTTDALFSLNDWHAKLEIENKQSSINKLDIARILDLQNAKAYEAEYKVFILWRAEKISTTMGNKLLKSLEEPDGKTLFILVCENTELMLPTILSRLQLVKIPKYPTSEFVSIISQRMGYTEEDAIAVSLLTENNLIDAFQAKNRENVFTTFEQENYKLFVSMMRSAYRICYFNSYPDKVIFPETVTLIKDLEALGRERQKDFLRYALVLIRKCILLNCKVDTLVKSSQEEAAWLVNFSPFINLSNAEFVVKVINNAITHIEQNVHTGILFTDLILVLGQLIQYGDKSLQKV
jgi:DNA polymerase-3 subunit delta'